MEEKWLAALGLVAVVAGTLELNAGSVLRTIVGGDYRTFQALTAGMTTDATLAAIQRLRPEAKGTVRRCKQFLDDRSRVVHSGWVTTDGSSDLLAVRIRTGKAPASVGLEELRGIAARGSELVDEILRYAVLSQDD